MNTTTLIPRGQTSQRDININLYMIYEQYSEVSVLVKDLRFTSFLSQKEFASAECEHFTYLLLIRIIWKVKYRAVARGSL